MKNEKELLMSWHSFKEKVTENDSLNRFTGERFQTFQELGDSLINAKDVYHYLLARHKGGTQPTSNIIVKNNFSPGKKKKKEKSFYHVTFTVSEAVSNSGPEVLNCWFPHSTLHEEKRCHSALPKGDKKATGYHWKGKSVKLTSCPFQSFPHQSILITYITN